MLRNLTVLISFGTTYVHDSQVTNHFPVQDIVNLNALLIS